MALEPSPPQSDFAEPGVTTWGGSIVYVPGKSNSSNFHMYAAEMLGSCGLTSWQSNSQVVHAVSSSPLGPWKREGVTLHG
jgi:hypothetical protein